MFLDEKEWKLVHEDTKKLLYANNIKLISLEIYILWGQCLEISIENSEYAGTP